MTTARPQPWTPERTEGLISELLLNALLILKKDQIIKDLQSLNKDAKSQTAKQTQPITRTMRSESIASTSPKQGAFEELCGCLTLVGIDANDAKQYEANAATLLQTILEKLEDTLTTYKKEIKQSIIEYGAAKDKSNSKNSNPIENDTNSIADQKTEPQLIESSTDYIALWNWTLSIIDQDNDTADYKLDESAIANDTDKLHAQNEIKNMFQQIIQPHYITTIRKILISAQPKVSSPSLISTANTSNDAKLTSPKTDNTQVASTRIEELNKVFQIYAVATSSYHNSREKILQYLIDKLNRVTPEIAIDKEINEAKFTQQEADQLNTRLKFFEKTIKLTEYFCKEISERTDKEISPSVIEEILEELKCIYLNGVAKYCKTTIETIVDKINNPPTISHESIIAATPKSENTTTTPNRSPTATVTINRTPPGLTLFSSPRLLLTQSAPPATPAAPATTHPTEPTGFIPSPPPAAPPLGGHSIDTKEFEKVITKEGIINYLNNVITEYKKFKTTFEKITNDCAQFFEKKENLQKPLSRDLSRELDIIKKDIAIFAKDPENYLAYMMLLKERMEIFFSQVYQNGHIKDDKKPDSQHIINQARHFPASLRTEFSEIIASIAKITDLKINEINYFTPKMETICNTTFLNQTQLEIFENSLANIKDTVAAINKLAELFKFHPNAREDGFIMNILRPYAIPASKMQTGSVRIHDANQNEKLLAVTEAIFKDAQMKANYQAEKDKMINEALAASRRDTISKNPGLKFQ